MSRARETLLCTCAYALLALLATWPLAPHLATHLPVGQLHEATVPYFNLWTLQWNADRIAHGYAGYWDAPIFYPAHGTFALSEPMTLPGLVYAPLGWAFGAVTAYGLLLLLSLMANAFAMRRLLACAGVAPLVATCGGALALGLPFVHKELGVLQLSLLAPPLCALAELRLAFRSPSRAVLIRLALAIAATLWSCVYYALLLAPLLLVAAVFLARPLLADARLRLPLLAAGLLLAASAAPLLVTQSRAVSRQQRADSEVRYGSAPARSYLQALADSPAACVIRLPQGSGASRPLYPGLFVVALAVLGFRRARRAREPDARRWALFCLSALAVVLVLSFGTRWQLGSFSPYRDLVQRVVPGFAQLRSPYRFAALVQLVLVVLASLGLDALARERAAHARWLVPVLTACALLEVTPFSAAVLQPFPSQALRARWIDWLAAHPGGALATVPPALGERARDYEPTTLAMLQSLRHGHPLSDGYSGFFLPAADRLAAQLKTFPSPAALHALHRARVRYVLADDAWLTAHAPPGTPPAPLERVRVVLRDSGKTLYELTR